VIAVPDSRLCQAATAYVRAASELSLFNHVMRTFAFGATAAGVRGIAFDRELFYVAAILHDLGLTELSRHQQRFELEGADAAKELLAREGMRMPTWIWCGTRSLHTTAGVPPRKRPEIALVQLGAAIDVGYASIDVVAAALPEILEHWPRLAFKDELLRYFDRLYERNPAAALQSPVVAEIVERRRGVRAANACDVIARAPFAE